MSKTPKSPYKEVGINAKKVLNNTGVKKKRWHGDRSKKGKKDFWGDW